MNKRELESALSSAEERISFLESNVVSLEAAAQRKDAQMDVALRRQSDIAHERDDWQARSERVFQRQDMEVMTRPQLISLIEQAINQARRKGMVEAEGLLQRHTRLTNATDIDVMEGVVREYTDRIAALKRQAIEQDKRDKEQVKLDTRPLVQKLEDYGLPNWWRVSSMEIKAAPTFQDFDERAKRIRKDAEDATKPLADGDIKVVRGDGNYAYTLSRTGDVVKCTCQNWYYQTSPEDRRTCKHLKKACGEQAELSRVGRPQPSCWCGVLLVRGQCQVHCTRWNGDERCNCGRLFAFCKDEYHRGRAPTRAWHDPRLAGTPEPECNKKRGF